MLVSIIVAVAENGVIGAANQLPWHLPEDLKYFKQVTMGKPIIMGRKTYESIGRPLPGRLNIVVTRQEDWQEEGVEKAESIAGAISVAKIYCQQQGCQEVMVIGGAEVYRLALPEAQRLYLTEVHKDAEGDTFFPAINKSDWQEVSNKSSESKSCTFKIMERVSR